MSPTSVEDRSSDGPKTARGPMESSVVLGRVMGVVGLLSVTDLAALLELRAPGRLATPWAAKRRPAKAQR